MEKLNHPELSLDLSLSTNSPFKGNISTKFPVSWATAMIIFATLLMLYLVSNSENKNTPENTSKEVN